jgi:hypothetical protein
MVEKKATKEVCLAMLDGKLDMLDLKIDELKDKQEDMAEDISKVKDAVYHPDEGLYARLRELEGWKKTSSKLLWMLISSMIGVISYIITKIIS